MLFAPPGEVPQRASWYMYRVSSVSGGVGLCMRGRGELEKKNCRERGGSVLLGEVGSVLYILGVGIP